MNQPQNTGFLEDIQQQIDLVPVSPGVRFVNFLIDSVIFVVIEFVIAMVIAMIAIRNGSTVSDISNFTMGVAEQYLFGFVFTIIIYTLFEGATRGRTIGKLATRTIAVKEDGSRITFKDAFLRSLCRVIPFEPFSAFGYRPWHDKFTHTLVIRKSN